MKRTIRTCHYMVLPLGEYDQVLDLQHRFVEDRKNGLLASDMFILTEHRPVFTLGRHGGQENIVISERFLQKKGIPVIPVERGGNVTYHGPGQLMVYPIINLFKSGLSIPEYVSCLEDIMIRICQDWKIEAQRKPGNPGVWVGQNKIGSIGLAVRRGISFHGMALNVNVCLDPFSWIHPCGLIGVRATSMAQILGRQIPMEEIHQAALRHIQCLFKVSLLSTDPPSFPKRNRTLKGL